MQLPVTNRRRASDDLRRDLRIAAVALALAVAFALRLALGDTGPVELVAVLLAAAWLGLRAARTTATIAAALLAIALAADAGVHVMTALVTAAALLASAELTGRLFERLELQAGELRTLRPLQNALAPSSPPELPLLEVGVRYLPATPGAAGDFYLVAESHNNSTVLAIGDVMGKGVKAAERGTFIRATIAAVASSTDDPANILRAANAQLVREYGLSADFITMLCVVVCADASLRWASAGHPAPVSLADGSPLGALRPAFPLGIAPELRGLEVVESELPDAGMLLYTDGLTDAKPLNFEPFGAKRIGLVLEGLGDPAPQEAVDQLAVSAQRFARRPLSDDVCLVAVRSKLARRPARLHEPRAAQLEEVPAFETAEAGVWRRRLVAAALAGVACGAAAVTAAVAVGGRSRGGGHARVTHVRHPRPAVASRPQPQVSPVVRLTRLSGAPRRAQGSGRVSDGRLDLTLNGLGQPRVRRGTVWLTSASGRVVPVARFAGERASIKVPLPQTGGYRQVQVSIRPAPTAPPLIERPVLSAQLPRLPAPPAP